MIGRDTGRDGHSVVIMGGAVVAKGKHYCRIGFVKAILAAKTPVVVITYGHALYAMLV